MRGADVYYGEIAENYDRSREVKLKWKCEQTAVERFLTEGPVLDVPFGTGRFVPVYRNKALQFTGVDLSTDMLSIARRKYPGVNAQIGSAFDLRFGDNEFATAVCVRFLEWLPLDRAAVVLNRLRRIARTLIVTITHGVEGEPEAFTYDFDKFLCVIDGLLIEDRQVTAHVRDMVSEAFKLRPARWSDVVAQFRHDYAENAESHIQRIADKHAGFFRLPPLPIREDTVTVRAEWWNAEKIRLVMAKLAGHRFVTEEPPRHRDAPITVVARDGIELIIDGRKRANIWMLEPRRHPVLVIRPNG